MKQDLSHLIEQLANDLALVDIDYRVETEKSISPDDLRGDCLLIKGDNLKALSNLSLGFEDRVDFCYIDPPYNTGGKFIYQDKRISPAHPIWGKHSEWMSFMLPRLVLARHLLSRTGVIAISIDDYEYAQLKILADRVFSSECYIATLVVRRSNNGKGGKPGVSVNHEYVLLYGKTSAAELHGLPEGEEGAYDKSDEYGEFRVDGLFRKKGDASRREDRPSMYYPLYYTASGKVFTERLDESWPEVFPVDSHGAERRWLWGKEKAAEESWKLFASKKGVIYVKNYNRDNKRVKIRSILDKLGYLTERATNEAKEIYGERVFETPKPLELIRDLIDCCSKDNAIVLDFFAGTGTTAHASYQLKKRDGSQRKTILVEHSHVISADHAATKEGFLTTAEITERRLKFIQEQDPSYSFSVIAVG
ncbi:adenine-specific DNA-methyltransferase [Massilia sp. UYP32]|uniref:site-specific DNA-methyltransferase n=1 Tax=Massilia sp. UYP32 TaxID=1756386 RepID=UPI003D22B68F